MSEHIDRALNENVRYDGRKKDEYRQVKIEYGISATACGSAKVTIGDTVVMAGVSLALQKPYDDTPDSGTLMVDVGMLPIANPNFESGPPGIKAIELARVTDRGIRESGCIDMKKLCVEKGEKVWSVVCDVVTLNADGNLFDAATLACMAALTSATFPEVGKDGVVNYKKQSKNKLPMLKVPIGITVWKKGEHLIVDPTEAEEEVLDSRLTVTTIESGDIVAMQKGGVESLMDTDVLEIVEIAAKKAKELRKHL